MDASPTADNPPLKDAAREPWIRFDRRELSGAFGDIGTDFPLLLGIIVAAGLDPARAFICFGLLQAASGLVYGIPMPNQPLKLVAAVVIAQDLSAGYLCATAWLIGSIMLLLVVTGWLTRLGAWIPAIVVRSIQLGLGIKLALLAVGHYMTSDGTKGFLFAIGCLALGLALRRNRRLPGSVAILAIGAALGALGWVAATAPSLGTAGASVVYPWNVPSGVWIAALFTLVIPQLPLSLGNSLLATERLAADWFPRRRVRLSRLGASYAFWNLAAGAFGGIPVCHGSGGLAGHYAFGARTGGSTIIYGAFYVVLSIVCLAGLGGQLSRLFPLCILGVLLLIEGATLMRRVYDSTERSRLPLTVVIGLVAGLVPFGFALALVFGPILIALFDRRRD